MQQTRYPAHSFHALLRTHPEAARFYDRCTPAQKQAIAHQLAALRTPDQLTAFVRDLPSAAL